MPGLKMKRPSEQVCRVTSTVRGDRPSLITTPFSFWGTGGVLRCTPLWPKNLVDAPPETNQRGVPAAMHDAWKDMFVLAVPILEKIIRPIIVYAFLVISLRLSGKRE